MPRRRNDSADGAEPAINIVPYCRYVTNCDDFEEFCEGWMEPVRVCETCGKLMMEVEEMDYGYALRCDCGFSKIYRSPHEPSGHPENVGGDPT